MIDWAAKWFEIRAEMGQSDLATFMYLHSDGTWSKFHFHHREADGFGRLQKLLLDQGYSVKAPSRKLEKPKTYQQPFLLLKGLLRHPKLNKNPWKIFNPEAKAPGVEDVGYWFFTAEEKFELERKAKASNMNPGFWLLSELNQLVRQRLFRDPQTTSTWLCPVDVRGAFPEADLNRNWVSFTFAQFQGLSTPTSTHEAYKRYKASLKSGLYWAFWELYQIGKYVGLKGMRKIAARAQNRSFWMGSFSDLGVWNQESLQSSSARDRKWVIAPPGSTSYPIGFTTIEWCGNRSVTLKIHPGICNENPIVVAQSLLSELKQSLLQKATFQSSLNNSSEIPKPLEYR